jgi:hypothetical protein
MLDARWYVPGVGRVLRRARVCVYVMYVGGKERPYAVSTRRLSFSVLSKRHN